MSEQFKRVREQRSKWPSTLILVVLDHSALQSPSFQFFRLSPFFSTHNTYLFLLPFRGLPHPIFCPHTRVKGKHINIVFHSVLLDVMSYLFVFIRLINATFFHSFIHSFIWSRLDLLHPFLRPFRRLPHPFFVLTPSPPSFPSSRVA